MQHAIIILLMLQSVTAFTFLYPSVTPSQLTINTLTTYTFFAFRQFDVSLNPTPYSTQPVPAGSSIIIVFPSQFTFANNTPTVTSLFINDAPALFNESVISNNVTMTGAVTADTAIANITVTVSNVLNPYPAVSTSPFIIQIGADVSQSSLSSSVTLQAASFSSCSISFNPSAVNTTGAMIVSIIPTNKILLNGQIRIIFPPTLQWSQDISTSHTIPIGSTLTCAVISGNIAAGSCSGQVSTTSVSYIISSINGTQITSAFSFSISSLFSPPTTTAPDTLTIQSMASSGQQIDTCSTTVSGLTPQVLTVSLSASTSPFYVNSGTSLIVTFTLPDTLSKDDYFQLTFPTGTNFLFIAVSTINLSIFSSSVTYVSANRTLVMRQAASSTTRYAGTVCRITVGRYTAPTSTLTATPFTLQVYNQYNGLKMEGAASLTATAKPYTVSLIPSSSIINDLTSYTFTITTQDNVLSTGMIGITFPSQLILSINSSCLLSNNFSSPASPSCQQNGSTVYVSNLSTATISPATFTFAMGNITNADRALTTSTFTVVVYYTNDVLAMTGNTLINGISMQPRQLSNTLTSVSLSNYTVLSSPITLNVTFTAVDGVAVGGSIQVVIPAQFTFVSGYLPQCQLQIGATSTIPACLINGSTLTVPLNAHSLTANDTVIISLKSFGTNPKSSQPTSPLQLYTITSNGYLVDYSNSTIIVNTFEPATFNYLALVPSNTINSASTSYNLELAQVGTWDVGSTVTLGIPSSITLVSPICINATDNSTLICSLINGSLVIQLSQSSSSASIIISGFTNPYSLQPTSAFTVTTYSPLGYSYAYNNNSLIITTTIASSFPSLSYSFSNQVYDAATNLTFTIINANDKANRYTLTPIGQFINVSNTNYSCSSSSFALTCTISADNLTITPVNSSLAFPINTSIQLLDLWVPVTNTTTMTLTSLQNTYLISSFNNIAWKSQCQLPCLTCSTNDSTICFSCFSNTAFTSNIYFNNNSCYSVCPTGTYAANGSLICELCTAPCLTCSGSAATCTECDQNSTTTVLNTTSNTCQSSCPSTHYIDNTSNITSSTPVCSLCLAPCATCLSSSLCLTCVNSSLFYYNQQCLTSCPVNLTIANTTSMLCQPCDVSCDGCIGSATNCIACSLTHPYYISSNACLSSCPSPLVPDTNSTQCVQCLTPCNTCFLTKTNCTSCTNGSFLSQVTTYACLLTCQQFYFANSSSNICESCSSVIGLNCNNCFNQSYCISCDLGFVLFTVNRSCLASVPSGFVNISGIATACASNCTECSVSTSNCTLCSGIYSLYLFLGSGQCLDACPNTTIARNNTCTSCTSPCLTCNALLTNCTTCLTGYLYLNSSTSLQECPTNCPSGYYINATSSTCSSCLSPCLSCVGSGGVCTSCNNSYLFNNTCVTVCPSNTLPNINTSLCQSCTAPCLTCSSATNNCTSCQATFYYFSANNRCYNICPVNISVNDNTNGSLQCLLCDSICLTCQNATNICTSCNQNSSLFNNSCVSCPSGYYSIVGVCQLCSNSCATCTGTSTTCTSCSSSLYYYQSTCIPSCPAAYGYLLNNTCTACSNSCLICNATDYCTSCPSTSALYNGTCVTTCPSPLVFNYNTTSLRFECFTQDQVTNQTNTNTLVSSLEVTSILPLPFTIITTFFFFCCLMSKLQYILTYITGVGYSLYGCAETGALAYLVYLYHTNYQNSTDSSTYQLLLWICLALIFIFNCISLVMVTPCLCTDIQFDNWLHHRPRGTRQQDDFQVQTGQDEKESQSSQAPQNNCCSHKCSFVVFTLVSLVTNFKLKLLIFTKLFRFGCLTANLEDIHSFRIFNIMSILGLFYEGLYFYIAVKLFSLFSFGGDKQLMYAILDCLVVMAISVLFAILTTDKDKDFFRDSSKHKKIDLGRRRKDNQDPKNMLIKNRKGIAALDSRDKLIDDSYGSFGDVEEIIVNHNIDSKVMPKKVSNSWVECPQTRSRFKSPERKNIFDFQDQEDYLPFESGIASARDRVDLYHTSIRPSRVGAENQDSKLQGNFMNRSDVIVKHKDIGINSVDQLEIDPLPLQSNQKHQIKLTDSEILGQVQQNPVRGFISTGYQPIIKETQSQNFNSSDKKSVAQSQKRNIFQSDVKILVGEPVANKVDLQSNNELNKTIQEGIPTDLKNISFESVLPFVHQNGQLVDKPSKVRSKEPLNKIMYPRTVATTPQKQQGNIQTAMVANSYLIEEEKSKQEQHKFEKLLDMSEIQQLPKDSRKPTLAPKIKSKIGFAPIQISQTISPQQQYNPKVEPDNKPSAKDIKEQNQVIHAPKTFSRTSLSKVPAQSLVQIEELQEFDAMVNSKQAYLRNLKAEVEKNNQLSKKSSSSRDGRKRSRKSLANSGNMVRLQVIDKNGTEQKPVYQIQSNYSESLLQTEPLEQYELESRKLIKSRSQIEGQASQNIFEQKRSVDPSIHNAQLTKKTESMLQEDHLQETYKSQSSEKQQNSQSQQEEQEKLQPEENFHQNYQQQAQAYPGQTKIKNSSEKGYQQLEQIREKEQISSRRQSIPQQNKNFEVEYKLKDVYQQEQSNKGRQQVQQSQREPKFVLQQEQADLESQSESQDNTMMNLQPEIIRQFGEMRPINTSSFDIRKTNKCKNSMPDMEQVSQEYTSPFLFDQNQQIPPSEIPLDSDVRIKKIRKASSLQKDTKQSRASQEKSNEQNHKELIYLLNKTQRNSRSKKKLPKEEKDERIVIKMDITQPSRQPRINQGKEENTGLVRKSMEKNKPLKSYTVKQDFRDYDQDEEYSEQPSRRQVMNKNSTAGYLPKQQQRSNRFISQKPASALELYKNPTDIGQNIPKTQKLQPKQAEIREFNFGDQISSQLSHTNFNSEAQFIKWKENISRQGFHIISPYPQHDKIPNQPVIQDLQQLEEYEEPSAEELPKPRNKQRTKQKYRVKNSRKKKSTIERIYGA